MGLGDGMIWREAEKRVSGVDGRDIAMMWRRVTQRLHHMAATDAAAQPDRGRDVGEVRTLRTTRKMKRCVCV